VISPLQRFLPTQDNITQKDEEKHPCLIRDSNPKSQSLSDQVLCLGPGGRCYWLVGYQYTLLSIVSHSVKAVNRLFDQSSVIDFFYLGPIHYQVIIIM
jgi:hypothetical protein